MKRPPKQTSPNASPTAAPVHSATRKIAYNTVIQVIGKVGVSLIAAVSVVVLTRYLGPEGYGKFNLALSYLGIFGILADVGLFTIVVREISKTPERTEELVGNVLTLRLVLSLSVIGLAFGIAQFLPYTPDVRVAILITGVAIFFGLLNSSMLTVFQARLRMDRSVMADTVGRLSAFAAVLVVAWLDLGFYPIVATAAVGSFATLCVTYFFARKMVRIRFLTDYKIAAELFKASIPLGIALALNQLYFRVDTLILSLYRPYQEVGLYSLAYKILEILLTFAGFFYNSVFPLLSRYIAEADARVHSTVQTAFDALSIVAVPLAGGGIVLAPQIIGLAGGQEFAGAVVPLQYLFVAAMLAFVNGLFGYSLVAKDKIRAILWLNVAALTFNVILNFIFIPRYGMLAAAVTTVLSEALILVGAYLFMKRYFGRFPSLSVLWKVLVAASLMTAALYLARDLSFLILLPLGSLLYFAVLYRLGGIDRSLLAKLKPGGA